MSVLLHPDSLSPDPLYGRTLPLAADGWARFTLHPAALADGDAARPWVPRDRWQPWAGCTPEADRCQHAEVLIDFGSEVEAEVAVELEAPAAMNFYLTCGESEAEARGWGGYGQGQWQQVRHWRIPAGRQRHVFPAVGLRFARLQLHDLRPGARLLGCTALCLTASPGQRGDLHVPGDPLLQRLWQTSLYTARVCTRPDDIWDGPKRDRLGWYGDARICQLAMDAGHLRPGPALAMLAKLPTDDWVNGIPNFSCDAVLMLRDLLLRHGRDLPGLAERVAQADALLAWIHGSQLDGDGLIRRTDRTILFGGGFVDWSQMPPGGDLPEQFCVQARHREALLALAQVHDWLGDGKAAPLRERATRLAQVLQARFTCPGGFHHTLRRIRPGFEKYAPGWTDANDLGPSGPGRHASAWAVLADLVPEQRRGELLAGGFIGPDLITPMFSYYELEARARLGEPASALAAMRDRLAAQVVAHDSACIWESFEPEDQGITALGLHGWPKSLCHGWGAGLVPLCERWLLGIEALAPGYARIRLHEPCLPLAFTATVPTPHGDLRLERPADGAAVQVAAPAGVEILRG